MRPVWVAGLVLCFGLFLVGCSTISDAPSTGKPAAKSTDNPADKQDAAPKTGAKPTPKTGGG